MISTYAAAGLTATLVLAYVSFKRFARLPLSKIRGPKSPSFIHGNLPELFLRPVGQADFEWQRLYGDVVRFKTVFGENQLLVSDPKALQWILSTSAYEYSKQRDLRYMSQMITGKGITWAEGEDHKRQRRILLPGFGAPENRAYLGIFQACAESMCAQWMELFATSNDREVVINIPDWISRAALDAIGQAAFDVQFDTIHNKEHPLIKAYTNILVDVFGRPSMKQILTRAALKYVPAWMLDWLTRHGSSPRLQRAREVKRVSTEVARNMVREKAETLLAGKGSRDIFSLLIKANMDSDAKNKLTEEELLSQMRTILFAGHETTASSMSWILLELARHPEIQSRLRSEIRAKEAAIRARGDTEFTLADFDAMPYTTAVIKEGLRFHCVIPHIHRTANKDGVLPLSRPITAETGQLLNEIIVPKGTRILVAIAAYNRNTDLWGEDAQEFNPNRWLKDGASGRKEVSIGVYSNLMTFSSGTRACLGWRFAITEIQAFLVEIVGKFEFTMSDQAEKVSRELTSLLMTPMISGEYERGCQMPLMVSVAGRDAT